MVCEDSLVNCLWRALKILNSEAVPGFVILRWEHGGIYRLCLENEHEEVVNMCVNEGFSIALRMNLLELCELLEVVDVFRKGEKEDADNKEGLPAGK